MCTRDAAESLRIVKRWSQSTSSITTMWFKKEFSEIKYVGDFCSLLHNLMGEKILRLFILVLKFTNYIGMYFCRNTL